MHFVLERHLDSIKERRLLRRLGLKVSTTDEKGNCHVMGRRFILTLRTESSFV
jgi:hypothetical protein